VDREKLQPAYYAVIPADVRYDKDLRPNAKLLYGELTSLCNQTGYCWAKNEYFAELYGVTTRTITNLLSQLEKKGYIRVETVATSTGSERRIYAGLFMVSVPTKTDAEDAPPEESEADSSGGVEKKFYGGIEKMFLGG
jgi:hypothetical protein